MCCVIKGITVSPCQFLDKMMHSSHSKAAPCLYPFNTMLSFLMHIIEHTSSALLFFQCGGTSIRPILVGYSLPPWSISSFPICTVKFLELMRRDLVLLKLDFLHDSRYLRFSFISVGRPFCSSTPSSHQSQWWIGCILNSGNTIHTKVLALMYPYYSPCFDRDI